MIQNLIGCLLRLIGILKNVWPVNSDSVLSGGSPRYNIYKTRDGGYVAAAPLEDRFWNKFCEAIDLPENYIKMNDNQNEVIQKVRELIVLKDKNQWLQIFAKADCCCSIVKSMEEAINDNHFKIRDVFSKRIMNENGYEIPALPLPIDNQFKDNKVVKKSPALGAHNHLFNS